MTALPQLELGDARSPFDEAVILIDGREEETITIECTGARELAGRLVELFNTWRDPATALAALSARLADEANQKPLTAAQAAEISRRST